MSLVKHSIGAVLFLLILCGWVAFHKKRPDLPTDKSLIRNFQKHRADFDRLVTMVNEDQDLGGIVGGQLLPDHETSQKDYERGFSEQRLNEYNLLFSRLADYSADTLFKQTNGVFIFTSADWLGPDENNGPVHVEKGYLYSTAELGMLVDSLDEMGFESSGSFYKKIDTHWYLYFDGSVNHAE